MKSENLITNGRYPQQHKITQNTQLLKIYWMFTIFIEDIPTYKLNYH